MTIVIGQQYINGVILISDSRASMAVGGKFSPWKDNTQKIFRLSPEIFIGFSGDIEFAGYIVAFLIDEARKKTELQKIKVFSVKGPKIIKHVYDSLTKQLNRFPSIDFIIIGMDYLRPARAVDENGKTVGHLAIYDKEVFKVASPNFSPEMTSWESPNIASGSGLPAFEELKSQFAKHYLTGGFGLSSSLEGIAMIFGDCISRKIKELGIDSVGGMIQIAIIDNQGAGYVPYQSRSSYNTNGELDLEINMDDSGRIIQKNLVTEKEMPLLFPPEVIKIKDMEIELFEI